MGGDEREQIVYQESRIIVAEDQHINQQVLAKQFTTLERIQDCDFCVNGVEAVDKVIKIYEESVFG